MAVCCNHTNICVRNERMKLTNSIKKIQQHQREVGNIYRSLRLWIERNAEWFNLEPREKPISTRIDNIDFGIQVQTAQTKAQHNNSHTPKAEEFTDMTISVFCTTDARARAFTIENMTDLGRLFFFRGDNERECRLTIQDRWKQKKKRERERKWNAKCDTTLQRRDLRCFIHFFVFFFCVCIACCWYRIIWFFFAFASFTVLQHQNTQLLIIIILSLRLLSLLVPVVAILFCFGLFALPLWATVAAHVQHRSLPH